MPGDALRTQNSVLPGKDRTPPPLLVFGGTFDPPHFAHLLLAECARRQFAAERVLFVPAGDPYLKRQRRATRNSALGTRNSSAVSPAHHRLAMLRLAVADNPAFVIDERELHRPGPSYTVDTLEELHSELRTQNSEVRLVLLLGFDSVADLPNWRNPERIRELATIASARNPATTNSEPSTQNSELIDCPALPISSTLIRERVAAGLPVRYLVPDAVAAYIAEHRLYGGETRDEGRAGTRHSGLGTSDSGPTPGRPARVP